MGNTNTKIFFNIKIETLEKAIEILKKIALKVHLNPIDGSKIIYDNLTNESITSTEINIKYPNSFKEEFGYFFDENSIKFKYQATFKLIHIYKQLHNKIITLGYNVEINQMFNEDVFYSHLYKLDKY